MVRHVERTPGISFLNDNEYSFLFFCRVHSLLGSSDMAPQQVSTPAGSDHGICFPQTQISGRACDSSSQAAWRRLWTPPFLWQVTLSTQYRSNSLFNTSICKTGHLTSTHLLLLWGLNQSVHGMCLSKHAGYTVNTAGIIIKLSYGPWAFMT